MDLCALRDNSGSVPADCNDLAQRAPTLINLLIAENAFLDSLLKKAEPVITEISALSDTIELSPAFCSSLPYGLAYLLIENEDPALSAVFRSRYEKETAKIRSRLKGTLKEIREVY